jgi:hypothetical protein
MVQVRSAKNSGTNKGLENHKVKLTSFDKELFEIVELTVYITTHSDGCGDRLYIRFFQQQRAYMVTQVL